MAHPEFGHHPEVAGANPGELLPVAKDTIKGIRAVVESLNKARIYSFAVEETLFVVGSMEEGVVSTGVVASIAMHRIEPNGELGLEQVRFNVISKEQLSMEKLIYAQPEDLGGFDDPGYAERFREFVYRVERTREQARQMGLLDVNQYEAEEVLRVLTEYRDGQDSAATE